MIGHLSGKVLEIDSGNILVDVNGVGYLVFVADAGKFKTDNEVQLYIHTNVKEDDISLFGFESKAQKSIFKMLLGVSGIGAKTSLAILSHGSTSQIQNAIIKADVDFFKNVPGIGKKTAQRVIIDLKTKVGGVTDLDLSEPDIETDDVYAALVGMGFDPKRVQSVLKEVDTSLSEQEKIKLAIKKLSG
jgi:Holliday junction DNA helicase RuvA